MLRLVRLQPPYLAACLLAVGLNGLSAILPGYRGTFEITTPQLLQSLLFDNLFLTGILGGSWILVVAWTLALEVQFYLLAGLMEPASQQQRSRRPATTMAIGLVGLSLAAWLWRQPGLVFSFLPVFALGWIAAHQVLQPRWFHWLGMAWLVLLLAKLNGQEQAFVAAFCVALPLLCVRWPDVAPSPLLWLGQISYSLFLIHVPIGGRVVNLASRMSLTPAQQSLGSGLAVALSILLAWAFSVLIERPSHRLSRWFACSI